MPVKSLFKEKVIGSSCARCAIQRNPGGIRQLPLVTDRLGNGTPCSREGNQQQYQQPENLDYKPHLYPGFHRFPFLSKIRPISRLVGTGPFRFSQKQPCRIRIRCLLPDDYTSVSPFPKGARLINHNVFIIGSPGEPDRSRGDRNGTYRLTNGAIRVCLGPVFVS